MSVKNYLNNRIGFMQGRLSPIENGMIQKFPLEQWHNELPIAKENNWKLMEWTIDNFSFDANPLIINNGNNLKNIYEDFNISIDSITADFFMQSPFFLADTDKGKEFELDKIKIVADSMSALNIKHIVLPLVDNGSMINNNISSEIVIDTLSSIFNNYTNISFTFESDFEPVRLLNFIEDFKLNNVGINYDSGNSSSLGFNCEDELSTYMHLIKNCHLKDRIYKGTTMPFGEGDANLKQVLEIFMTSSYEGNFIIQGARSNNDEHIQILNQYRNFLFEL